MCIASAKSLFKRQVGFQIRQHCQQLFMVESFHCPLAVTSYIARTGQRYRVQIIMIKGHFYLQGFHHAQYVIDAVSQFIFG